MSREVYSGQAVKRAAWQFLTGKAVSGLLTFVILLWLVRLLPVPDYGAYVVLVAGAELGFALAGLGLPWLAARYVPDYRLHADGSSLVRLCRRLVLWQMLALASLAIVVALVLDAYLVWAGLSGYRQAAWLALALLVAEGLGRFLREGLMGPLMLQGEARTSLVLRQFVFLAAIAVLSFAEQAKVVWVLTAEAGAAALGWLVAAGLLARHLRALRAKPAEPGWRAPPQSGQWLMALRMYGAHIVTLAYGPQVLINLVQRSLGGEAAALFGFLRTLYEQVARYLPATLLFTVLRPKLMASHLQGGISLVGRQANLAGKLSLLFLLPLVVLAALGGDALVTLLSGGKFEKGGAYLFGLLLALVPFSQRQLIETVAVAAGRAGLCVLGSAMGLLALPLLFLLLGQGLGLWAPIAAIVFGQVLFNAVVVSGLARLGYRPDWSGAAKLAASALLAWLAAEGLLRIDGGNARLVAAGVVGALVFLALAWRLGAVSIEERRKLGGLIGLKSLAR